MAVVAIDEKTEVRELGGELLLDLYRRMLEIRFFEEEVHKLFVQNLVRGSTHLYDGQEAVAVGACSVLTHPQDTMLCTYRGHGAVLAKGAALDRSFGEILGRSQGLCRGKGGSMHLTDFEVGAIGSFAIIGAHLPIAVGAAFTAWYTESGAVSLCFFGDGTTNIGAFHEALNMAQVWKLPVIFVCENNLYGEYSPLAWTTAGERIIDRALALGMSAEQIDGNDVLVVRRKIGEAVERARAGEGPTFVEALTYRQKGHSRTDPALYRPEGELERWLERDPIVLLERRLRDHEVASEEEVEAIRGRARSDTREALERALSWPDPSPEERFDHVFTH